jgi:hypothetical protein
LIKGLFTRAFFRNFTKDLKIKVMFKNFFKYTPTQQEQQFIDIVAKLLEHHSPKPFFSINNSRSNDFKNKNLFSKSKCGFKLYNSIF